MQSFSYQMNEGVGTRARLGIIVLQTDETLEYELRTVLPEEHVALYTTRIPSAPEVSKDGLMQMKSLLSQSAELLPHSLHYDVIGYGCTSASSVIGSDEVAKMIKIGANTRNCTNPVDALVAACRFLGIKKLGFLSPYIAEVSTHLRQSLQREGIENPAFGSFNEAKEANVARIDGPSLQKAARALYQQGAMDGIFLSCTNLQSFDVIAPIEAECGCPVLSSNLVLAWHMLRLSGLTPKQAPTCHLFRKDA